MSTPMVGGGTSPAGMPALQQYRSAPSTGWSPMPVRAPGWQPSAEAGSAATSSWDGPRRGPMTARIAIDQITDDYIRDRIARAKAYTLIVLKPTPEYAKTDARPIVWEHGRRNMALQAAGIMPIVCPVGEGRSRGSPSSIPTPRRPAPSWLTTPAFRPGSSPSKFTRRGFPGDALPS